MRLPCDRGLRRVLTELSCKHSGVSRLQTLRCTFAPAGFPRRKPRRQRWRGSTRSIPQSTRWSIIGRRKCWHRPTPSMPRSRAMKIRVRWRVCRLPLKVNVDQKGFATTNGVKLQRDLIAAVDSPVVANLRKAGAILLGRTNCPAFSFRWFTTNLLHGDTKNPRDPGITPGGSSGGAGAAVAAGIGHIAHGTDIAGSIRYPAYACGVHGLRPTLGRIPAFQCVVARTCDRATDIGGFRPARAYRWRSQDCARCDVRSGRARSVVCAGAAGRAPDGEACCAVSQS